MGDVFSPPLKRNDLAPYETLGLLTSKCSLLGISLVNKKAYDQVKDEALDSSLLAGPGQDVEPAVRKWIKYLEEHTLLARSSYELKCFPLLCFFKATVQ